ncbi:UDP-3-O-(3-hydroxymyristoyl)glucosamine N-acyltransferase [Halioxenophilus sp. WMMB6]|uniref:UDP-3-O-(3-hydroxymyristoyl)glucosamine N-acyltransferase n=1 Tax=Halioxenophilus sp. WMMB6 TaxID=3073815 RepID=UPI00295E42C8|nr:UDP-3-O-(3-hydroxymyristoyl)glucosamine N-acyltransferase [Halioxenophilus sp. WMMB6]
MISLSELANQIGAELRGDELYAVSGLNTPDQATAAQVAFVARAEFLPQLAGTKAGAVILTQAGAEASGFQGNCLLVDDPYLAYAKASRLFDHHFHRRGAGVHASAVVADGVVLGSDVQIGANAVVESGAVIESGVVIGPGCFIGADTKIGADTLLHANVTIYHQVELGKACVIHSGTVLGSDGFGFAPSPAGWVKIHQLGRVIVGDRVEIGANTAIDRGALGDTVIADGVIIDNLVHIAHNVAVGNNTAIAGCCGFAGSTKIGANCTFAGQVGVTGHIEITDNAHFMGKAMVTNSVTEPGVYASGIPLAPVKKWRKNAVRFGQLDELARLLSRLAKKLGE